MLRKKHAPFEVVVGFFFFFFFSPLAARRIAGRSKQPLILKSLFLFLFLFFLNLPLEHGKNEQRLPFALKVAEGKFIGGFLFAFFNPKEYRTGVLLTTGIFHECINTRGPRPWACLNCSFPKVSHPHGCKKKKINNDNKFRFKRTFPLS